MPEAAPREVGDDVGPDGADHDAAEQPGAFGAADEEPGEPAEDADVGEDQHGQRDVDRGPLADDLEQVPEHREGDHEERHQRVGPLAVVVRDGDHRDAAEQPDEHRGVVAGLAERVEELERVDADDDGDEERGDGPAGREAGDRDDGHDDAGDDPLAELAAGELFGDLFLAGGGAFEAASAVVEVRLGGRWGDAGFGGAAAAAATAAAGGSAPAPLRGAPGFLVVVVAQLADHGAVVVAELAGAEVTRVPVVAVGAEPGPAGAGQRRPGLEVVVGVLAAGDAGHLAGGRVGPVREPARAGVAGAGLGVRPGRGVAGQREPARRLVARVGSDDADPLAGHGALDPLVVGFVVPPVGHTTPLTSATGRAAVWGPRVDPRAGPSSRPGARPGPGAGPGAGWARGGRGQESLSSSRSLWARSWSMSAMTVLVCRSRTSSTRLRSSSERSPSLARPSRSWRAWRRTLRTETRLSSARCLTTFTSSRRRSAVSSGNTRRITLPSLLGVIPRSLDWMAFSIAFFGRSQYGAGMRYSRSCEVYFSQAGKFCQRCGMTLRSSPTNRNTPLFLVVNHKWR